MLNNFEWTKRKSLLLFCKLESRPSEEIWIFTEADRTFCAFHSTFSTEISNISFEHEIGTSSNKERWQAELNFCWRVCRHLSLFSPFLSSFCPPFSLPSYTSSLLFSMIFCSKTRLLSVQMFCRHFFFLTSSQPVKMSAGSTNF